MILLEQLKHFPETVQFNDVISYIDAHYDFTPTAFKNGNTRNEEGQNNGSCKIFGFASYHGLTKRKRFRFSGILQRRCS